MGPIFELPTENLRWQSIYFISVQQISANVSLVGLIIFLILYYLGADI